ncbi:hypothetical protein PHYBOEH_004963 [Phytophthora boehmeriae]|uniref:Vacuolar protein sorting-associated protein n=1 Tax=Phytophthora boehmeriae TaxID=109152 RepID=A0A8T1WML1_9STRA|nr:hypothetical protein PHYBOEH_004963 [Phytophthora boehmeriae]
MIFGVLQQVLNELFVDVQEEKVSFYHGDLFEPSHFRLNDVFLKTTLINTLQLPFELAAGYIGHVNVEGLVGAVAGFPLDIKVNDICLVLRPKQVEWGNELLMRYARELVVVIWQSLMAPSVDKKGGALFISPAKWLSGRIQAARADTIVQLERIHIRVESERSGKLVAYGLHIPLIRFAPREIEEQILYRRQQPGVTYPKASDNSTSKLLTLEKVSLYTDLNAKAFWTPPSEAERWKSYCTEERKAFLVSIYSRPILMQLLKPPPYPYPHDGEDETANPVTEYKWISGDYIREPEDGFFYVGLKYSSHEFAAKPTGRVQFMGDEEWSLKGRMCIGPTKIDCNEAAMRAAMGAAKAAEMRAEIDFSAPTHFSILSDTYHSFIRLVAQFPKKKKKKLAAQHSADANALNITTIAKASVSDPPTQGDTTDGQDQLQNQVKMARLLHALLLRSSTFELEVGSLELNLSAYTSHMDRVTHSSKEATGAPESREDVNVTIPMTTYRLQNRPTMNECLVDVAGARIVYRSTMQGRAAVVRHLSQYLKL